MTECSLDTLFGHSPNRYGVLSVIAVGFAFACWPLMVVIGFVMVYVAALLALIAVVSGLLGIGSGLYFRKWGAVVAGALGTGLAVAGICFIVSALSHF
ncbi:MAG: hypothetical protein R3C01_09745 [Planctomycetaceae bacterium]